MKTKFFGILIVVMFILQSITFTSVFADTTSPERVVVDFSADGAIANASGIVAGVHDYSIVKGQFGKALDDASLRLYSHGGTTAGVNGTITVNMSVDVAKASDGEYSHLSFQFLNEDGYSTLGVKTGFYSTAGKRLYTKEILTQSRSSGLSMRSIILNGATNKKVHDSGLGYGEWHQLDVYFSSSDSTAAAYFLDGKKYAIDATKWAGGGNSGADDLVANICALHLSFTPKTVSPYKASAVQFDNFIVEKVNKVPDEDDIAYRYRGELYDFETGASISSGNNGVYNVDFAYGQAALKTVKKFANSSFLFRTGSDYTIHTIEANTVGSKPSYDHVVHTQIPETVASNEYYSITYNSNVDDLKPGDYGHLTFSFAQNTTTAGNLLRSVGATLSNGTTAGAYFTEINTDGSLVMFGQDTGKAWELGKWHKVDFIFKVGNGTDTYTKVDGYIDGEKVLSDYEWIFAEGNYSNLKSIGNLAFGHYAGSDYYLDDIGFYVFDADSLHNPAIGYSLISASAEDVFADDKDDIVALTSETKSYSSVDELFTNSSDVTVCNIDGTVAYSGELDSDKWIKVSNGFGGGVYYNVGYKSDKLAIGDIVFDSEAKTLKSQAEVGFGIREDYNAPVAPYPTSGIVIVALYNGDELESCTPVPYSNLTDADPAEAVIQNVESITGKTVKVFILDATDGITPLVVNKVK
ncbi:MAG: hypothetical protein IKJ68_07030 [Clostridia bacterium]|nr:hypothetical protein [Clostridia bacterium]